MCQYMTYLNPLIIDDAYRVDYSIVLLENIPRYDISQT